MRPNNEPRRSGLRFVAAICAVLAPCIEASASQGSIRIVFATETPAPEVLVVVRSLADGSETGRFLSDSRGQTPSFSVKSDELYQVIGTCPYGICDTVVREVFGFALENGMLLQIPVKGSDSEGIVVGPSTTVVVRSARGRAVAKLGLLVRTLDAHHQRWYHTDEHGDAAVVLPRDPAVIVVAEDRKIFTFNLASDCHSATMVGAEGQCVPVQGSEVVLNLH